MRKVCADLKACNRRARNDRLNRAVQSFLYTALQDEHEGAAKKSLAVLTELYRRQVWRDARTVNVIGKPSMLHRSKTLPGHHHTAHALHQCLRLKISHSNTFGAGP